MVLEIRDKLKKIMERKGISQRELSKRLGLGASTLSEYLNDKYEGNIEEIENKILIFLDDHKEENKVKEIDFLAETETSAKIYGALNYLRRSVEGALDIGVTGSGKIALISGKAGRGKTWTIKKYVEEYKGKCIMIEAESNYTYADIIRAIASHLRIDTHHRVKTIYEDVLKALTGTGMIVIIDEAEHLKNDTIEQIRRIADKTGVGIALIGLESLLDKLRRLKGDFEYLFSRIVRIYYISDMSKEDTEKIVSKYLSEYEYSENEIEELSKIFYEESRGSVRRLANLLPASLNTMRLNGMAKLTKQVIKQTNLMTMMPATA